MLEDHLPPDLAEHGDLQHEVPHEVPHAVDAECAVLGALLINNDLFAKIDHALLSEYFYDKRNRVVYKEMMRLYDAGHVDPLLLAQALRGSKLLQEAGGDEYIANLADIGAAPVNVQSYAELIVEKAYLRGLIGAHHDSLSEGYYPEGKKPRELQDAAEARLSELGEKFRRSKGSIRVVKDIAKEYTDMIIDNSTDLSVLRGTHPGFDILYEKTLGFNGGDLIVLAGRPGTGKTAFGLNLVRNIASREEKMGALCFSLEMSAEQLVMRMLAQHGLNTHKMRRADSASADTLKQLASASSELEKLTVHIDDSSTLNILEARTRARRVKREMQEKGMQLGLIMVDYLQLMESHGKQYDNRALEVAVISRGLKALAKELNTPVLALSQLNRGLESRSDPRPVMSDLRDSGSIEQDADLILFLHSKADPAAASSPHPPQRQDVQLIIGKQRNGPIGTIPMEFNKPMSLFSEKQDNPYGDAD